MARAATGAWLEHLKNRQASDRLTLFYAAETSEWLSTRAKPTCLRGRATEVKGRGGQATRLGNGQAKYVASALSAANPGWTGPPWRRTLCKSHDFFPQPGYGVCHVPVLARCRASGPVARPGAAESCRAADHQVLQPGSAAGLGGDQRADQNKTARCRCCWAKRITKPQPPLLWDRPSRETLKKRPKTGLQGLERNPARGSRRPGAVQL